MAAAARRSSSGTFVKRPSQPSRPSGTTPSGLRRPAPGTAASASRAGSGTRTGSGSGARGGADHRAMGAIAGWPGQGRGPVRTAAGNSTSKPSSTGSHRFDPRNRIGAGLDDMSPRLLSIDDGVEIVGAALLPDVDERPPERFCVDGPVLEAPGMPSRRSSGVHMSQLSFPMLVTRLEQAVTQASVMLCERLKTLRMVWQNCGGRSDSQVGDLCDLADGIAAASYHLQKWAATLSGAGASSMPPKPSQCEDADEAFAMMHSSTPRILMGAGESHKGLAAAIKAHGTEAEGYVNKLGVPTKDLRMMGPHLEIIIGRLGRLSSRIRADRQRLRDFIPSYFAPVLGPRLAEHLLVYLKGADGFL